MAPVSLLFRVPLMSSHNYLSSLLMALDVRTRGLRTVFCNEMFNNIYTRAAQGVILSQPITTSAFV